VLHRCPVPVVPAAGVGGGFLLHRSPAAKYTFDAIVLCRNIGWSGGRRREGWIPTLARPSEPNWQVLALVGKVGGCAAELAVIFNYSQIWSWFGVVAVVEKIKCWPCLSGLFHTCCCSWASLTCPETAAASLWAWAAVMSVVAKK
jgi:hypothetical protein